MRCRDFEKLIYLYDEIEENERKEVNRHISSCDTCNRIYQNRSKERMVVKRLHSLPVQGLEKQVVLTDRIMADVTRPRKRQTIPDYVLSGVFFRPMQYGLALASLLLIGFFVREYNQSVPGPVLHPDKSPVMVELNSATFYKQFQNVKRTGGVMISGSLYQCLQNCQAKRDENCLGCRIRFTKLNKQHENI